MTERPGSHDLLYVHTDIPPGMTIREWRAERAAARSARKPRRGAGPRLAEDRTHSRAERPASGAAPRGVPEPGSQRMTSQPEPRGGSVYLLHFEPSLPVTGNRVARHFLGFAERDVDSRVAQHLQRQGSPLVAAVVAAGGRVTLERVWVDVHRGFDRRLKRRRETPRLCPRCVCDGLTAGRGPLSPAL